jgi:sulfoxide reductase heme-binding subunit YedZ
MIALKAPWNERNGRFSPLKAIVFAALFAPAAWISFQYVTGGYFPKPVTEMIHHTGEWALRLILLSLLVTPLRKIAQWPKLIAIRRMVGVAAFAYACAHLTLYVVDQKFDLVHVASEIALRFYLTIGFIALLGLGALAATSTDKMIKRLGAARWNRLHGIVYAIGVLAILHFYIQSKADVSEPVMMTGFFLMLMLYRSLVKRAPLGIAVLGSVVAGTALTALAEATWYAIRRGYDFWEVLGANIDPDMFPRPTAYVIVAGLAALIVLGGRELQSRRASRLLVAAE